MEPTDASPKKERHPNPYAITSLVLAIAPIIIWLLIIVFFISVSGESNFGFIAGASWPWVLILVAVAVIIVLVANILAVIFGVIAIIKRKTLFSWLGIIIVAVEALLFAAA